MTAALFALTKIQPPRERRSRLQRPALEARLDAALAAHRVLLVQAPAGYGKTSALAALLARLGQGTVSAWVSLDADDDAQRLFACLVAALEPADLPWRSDPEALVAQIGQEGGLSRALAEMLNALAGTEGRHGVILLEDLHRVTDGSALALVEGLVERLPSPWSVVLSSRTAPALPLARWRAAGELAEVGPERLAFTAAETQAWFDAEADPALRARAAELHERTQGWPAGLRLCLSALPASLGGGTGRIDRHLFDYLAAEVLEQMPQDLQRFLLRCAVLPELTVARCAAVSGDRHAARWIDEIERRGLFVTALEAQEPTLVLHDLLRDALQERLRRLHPEEWPVLLQRAAAGEPDPVRRIGYRLRADDWDAAEQALAEAAPELMVRGAAAELQRLALHFPEDWRQASARLLRLQGMGAFMNWQWEEGAARLAAAVAAAQRAGDTPERQRAMAYLANVLYPLGRNEEAEALIAGLAAEALPPDVQRVALMAECSQCLRRGEHDRLPALYARMLDALDGETDLFAWWECLPAVNWSTLPGMRALIQRYLRGLQLPLASRELPLRAEAQVHAAFAALWSGEVSTALALADEAEADARWLAGGPELQVSIDLFRVIEAAMHGDRDRLERRLDTMRDREAGAPPERRRQWEQQIAAYGLRLGDCIGPDAEALRRWSARLKDDPLQDPSVTGPRADAVRARWAAAQGRWAEAAERFAALLPMLPTMDTMAQAVELRLRAAHALQRAGRVDEAAAAAVPALERLRTQGDRGMALLCGPSLLQALQSLRLPSALAEELAATTQLALGLRRPETSAPADAVLPGALSEREAEVLRCLAAGDSNKLIARALDISPHTVKRHVANILDKLGLASRGQAAAWWRERV